MTPKTQVNKEKLITWTASKLKLFYFKGHYEKNEKITHRMEETFANHISDKG